MDEDTAGLVQLAADIVTAHVSHNKTDAAALPDLIRGVYAALRAADAPAVPDALPQEPAVPIRQSVKRDYIVCLEDGAKLKMLKRYLRTRYDMTPEDYREKWGLPKDYPMVAPAYAEQRRTLAQAIGLGRKGGEAIDDVVAPATVEKPAPAAADEGPAGDGGEAPAPKRRGRPRKTAEAAD